MSFDLHNARVLHSAQRRYDAQLPHDEPENPDCPECGTTMDGKGDRWQWNFTCPKCGFNLSGDNN